MGRVVMVARTGAGSPIEHTFGPTIKLADLEASRAIVETEHRKLGHHLCTDGSERTDQHFAGFVPGCVPQSEARSLLERAKGRTPPAVLAAIEAGGIENMMLLYALTLERAKSRKRPGGGVWLGEI